MFKFRWNSCVSNGQECSVTLPLYCAASPTPKKSKQVQVLAKSGTMTTSTSCTELIFWKVELYFGHFVDCLTICEFLQRLSLCWLYSSHLCTEQKLFFISASNLKICYWFCMWKIKTGQHWYRWVNAYKQKRMQHHCKNCYSWNARGCLLLIPQPKIF